MNKDAFGPRAGRGLYRDRENGWLFGVCAGIADYGNLPVAVLRVIAVVGLLTFFWATVVTYAAATLFLREKPLTWAGRCKEYEFWRRCRSDDRWSHS